MSGLGKDVSGMVRISRDEVGAGTFPDNFQIPKLHALVHYIENSYQLGVPDDFSTETLNPCMSRCVKNHINPLISVFTIFRS